MVTTERSDLLTSNLTSSNFLFSMIEVRKRISRTSIRHNSSGTSDNYYELIQIGSGYKTYEFYLSGTLSLRRYGRHEGPKLHVMCNGVYAETAMLHIANNVAGRSVSSCLFITIRRQWQQKPGESTQRRIVNLTGPAVSLPEWLTLDEQRSACGAR